MSWVSNLVDRKPASNSYVAPDLSFLKSAPDYSSYYKSLTDLYNPIMGAQTQNAKDQLSALSGQIDLNTNAETGKGIGSYGRRGLINPDAGGVTSDIASVGLADIANNGTNQKNQLGLQFQQNQLDMLKSLLGTSVNQAFTGQQDYASDLLKMAGDSAANYNPGSASPLESAFTGGISKAFSNGISSLFNPSTYAPSASPGGSPGAGDMGYGSQIPGAAPWSMLSDLAPLAAA